MKKNDIIAQKLFETCKLSEFYLNLLKSEDESPMQLAHAYKQKLYEIVDRYDRLLDDNKHKNLNGGIKRDTYSFDFDNNISKTMKPKSLTLSKKSTTNKSMSALNTPLNQTPISVLTSSSSTYCMPQPNHSSNPSSYASTPATTPGHHTGSIKSSFATYNRGSSRSIYSQAYQQHHYSNKQMQKFAYLYNESSDESEAEESDDIYFDYNSVSVNKNVSCQLEYDNYSTSGHSKKSVLTNSESDTEEEEKSSNNNSTNNTLLNVYSNKNIEKSYSNLSKDSGVFGESYHSECSNHHITGIGSKQNESSEERVSDEEQNTFDENLTSPASTASSSNNYEVNNFHSAESTPKPNRPTTEIDPPQSFIWGQVTRMVEERDHEPIATETEETCSSLPTRPVKPLKSKFLMNKLNNPDYQNQSKNLLKASLVNNSLLKQTNRLQNFRTYTKNQSYNVDVDHMDMTSLITTRNDSCLINSENNNNSSMQQIDEESTSNDEKSAKSPFIFNCNTNMMNVSMLDNIQATNNSEIDMNCSILMFN